MIEPSWYSRALSNLGFRSLVLLQLQKVRQRMFRTKGLRKLTSAYAQFPLFFRANTSDLSVFHQIFVNREYRCLDECDGVDLIIDCGANVGFSSAYLLTRFPDSSVLALEPDPQNYALLCRNLAPYGDRARVLNVAVWSHVTNLVIDEDSLCSGDEWGRRVKPPNGEESLGIEAVDINWVIEQAGVERVSILKMDIEGSEKTVFAGDVSGWLCKVDAMVVELHGEDCEEVFYEAVLPQQFEISKCDELTGCMRP